MQLALRIVPLAIVAGCGGNRHPDSPADAAPDVAVDAALDGAVDAPGEQLDAPLQLTHTHYVLDRELLPATGTDYAFDVDGDTIADNQVGVILGQYAALGYDNQRTIDVRLARGEAIVLADLGAHSYTDDPSATFTMYQGADPMPPACAGSNLTTCGRHLLGTGSFSIKAGAPVDPPLVGAIAAGKLTAGPGHLTVQFSIGDSGPIMVTLVGARVELTPAVTSLMGKVGGAIPQSEISAQILPGLRESFAEVVYRDCNPFGTPPGCDCQPGSQGEKVIAQLDKSPSDCGISLSEVANDPATTTMLAPDVTVEGQPALSIGFGVTAVHGTFVAPM